MALATTSDVEARLGRSLTATEQTRAEGLIPEADVLVLAYLGMEVEPAPVPAAVTIVSSRMVARAIERAATPGAVPDAQSVTNQTGPFGRTVTFSAGTTSGGPWLAATDKVMLKPHRVGGMAAVAVTTGRSGRYRTDGAL